jgi:hypothetical protein
MLPLPLWSVSVSPQRRTMTTARSLMPPIDQQTTMQRMTMTMTTTLQQQPHPILLQVVTQQTVLPVPLQSCRMAVVLMQTIYRHRQRMTFYRLIS